MRERAHSGTGLFMTELILVILFFSIAAACCLEAFAASSRLHERARRLEQALNSTENLVQQLRGLQGGLEGLREYYPRMTEGENPELFFDGEGNPCGSEAGEYGITLTRTQEEGLVYVLLESRDMQGEELYTLRAPICVREEGQDG